MTLNDIMDKIQYDVIDELDNMVKLDQETKESIKQKLNEAMDIIEKYQEDNYIDDEDMTEADDIDEDKDPAEEDY